MQYNTATYHNTHREWLKRRLWRTQSFTQRSHWTRWALATRGQCAQFGSFAQRHRGAINDTMCFNTLCLDPGRVPMILQHMAIERLERGNWVELDFWYLAAWVGATCRYHVCYIHKRCYFFLQFHVIGQCECRVPSLSSLPVSLHRSLFGRCSSESTRVGQGAHELWLTCNMINKYIMIYEQCLESYKAEI